MKDMNFQKNTNQKDFISNIFFWSVYPIWIHVNELHVVTRELRNDIFRNVEIHLRELRQKNIVVI